MGRRWALPQSVQVIIPPELKRSAQTRVLSKSDLEESPMTQRLDYTAIAPAGMKALGSVYGYIVQSGLPRLLVNLVYLRVSQINGCAYCIDMHSRDLIKEGLAVEKLVLVQAWREADSLFDTRECSALAWAETVTCVADTAVPDADFQAASAVFSEKELVDLTIAIGPMNTYNRLAIGFRVPPKAALSEQQD
jgi:AhpD family alkylhydroperoxidase